METQRFYEIRLIMEKAFSDGDIISAEKLAIEYLEIAKEYSTPKSSIFINGILDKLVKKYQANNSLKKEARGLM